MTAICQTRPVPRPTTPSLPHGWDRCTITVEGVAIKMLVHAHANVTFEAGEVPSVDVIGAASFESYHALELLFRWLRCGGRP